MNGYSKIMRMSTTDSSIAKPRSIDLISDSYISPQPKQAQNFQPHHQREADHHHHHEEEEEGAAGGDGHGGVLSRTCSSASQRFRASERAANGSGAGVLQGAVRRAFSMRKGSSLAEGYWRIHDSTADDEDGEEMRENQMRRPLSPPSRTKKRGRIFRACKRLFGF